VQVDRRAVGEGLGDRLHREGMARARGGDLTIERADGHAQVVLAGTGEEGQLGDVSVLLRTAGDAAVQERELAGVARVGGIGGPPGGEGDGDSTRIRGPRTAPASTVPPVERGPAG